MAAGAGGTTRRDVADEAPLLEAPAQEAMDSVQLPQPTCKEQVRDACAGLATFLLCTAMALVLVPLGLPAFLLVGSLDLLGNLYEVAGGNRKDWTLFVLGAEKPDEVPEQCNRETAGKMEALRGKDWWPNFIYFVRNNHPVFGVICCEYGHPFSPVERTGLLVLLLSFAYFMAGLRVKFIDYLATHEHWREHEDWLWIGCYSLLCITLPSMMMQSVLKYFALVNYRYILNKYNYFAKRRDERCRAFARQFCMDRGLGVEHPQQQGKRRGGGGFGDCDCCKHCCKFMDACKACNNSCEDGKAQAVNSLFASLFAGLAFAGSCVFVIFGIRLDIEASEEIWRSLCLGTGLNFFVLWPLQAIGQFLVLWQYQHWEGPRWELLGKEIPPEPEVWVEMRQFFRILDRNGDGLLSKEEMSHAVAAFFGQDLSEEGWAKLLRELDADQDGQLSLRELEKIRFEFAAKTGWWVRPDMQMAV